MSEQRTNRKEEHLLLVEMAKIGPQCNWIKHDGAYTEEDKIAQEKFLKLGSHYYNDLTIHKTLEEKAEKILAVKI